MEPNTHIIKTVQDMADCTNESNIDNFLIDLKNLLSAFHKLRKETDNQMETKVTKFLWIDDGKNEVTIRAVIK